MPLNPLDNFPEALIRQNMVASKYCNSFLDVKFEDQSKEWKIGTVPKFALSKNYESIDGTSHVASSTHPMSILMKQAEVISLFHPASILSFLILVYHK